MTGIITPEHPYHEIVKLRITGPITRGMQPDR